MTVENGRGYRTADENAGKEREIGVIPVDSQLFAGRPRQVRDRGNPRRPAHQLRQAGHGNLDQRHHQPADGPGGRREDPAQAPEPVHPVRRAGPGDARSTTGPRPAPAAETVDHELERKLNMSLAELELSVRATNCLESEGITTVRDLVIRTDEELLEVRNFGETTLQGSESQAGRARPAPGHEAAHRSPLSSGRAPENRSPLPAGRGVGGEGSASHQPPGPLPCDT